MSTAFPQHRPIGRRELLLLVTSFALSLLLGEVALRAYYAATYSGTLRDLGEELPPPGSAVELGGLLRMNERPRLVYRLKAGLDNVYKGARVRTNSAGWREEELPFAKDEGLVRIVGLGDSVMFGHGVEAEERYTDVLEELLNQRHPAARWESVNLAVSGYNLVMEVEALKRFGLAYDPDFVLYGFIGNDFCLPNFVTDPLDVLSFDSFLVHYLTRAGTVPKLTDREEVLPLEPSYDRGEQRYDDFFRTFCEPRNIPRQYRHLAGRESFVAALEELAAIGRERGIRIVLLRYREGQVEVPEVDGIVYLSLARSLQRIVTERGFRMLRQSDLVLSAADPHLSPAGHRVIAELLLERMVDLGLVQELVDR